MHDRSILAIPLPLVSFNLRLELELLTNVRS